MKRSPLRRRALKKAAKVRTLKPKYSPPDWFLAIKPGAHGSTPHQKRLWRMVSEAVRQEEFIKYRGKCVSCDRYLHSWQEGQCAHFKPWSVCNGLFKYERKNLAFSCSFCNSNSGGDVGHRFGEELKRRYGEHHLDWIEKENRKHHGEKLDVLEIVALAEQIMKQNHE